ncbi:hypothetical protein ACTFIY_011437 [Dictyostelium cf. discoideum]
MDETNDNQNKMIVVYKNNINNINNYNNNFISNLSEDQIKEIVKRFGHYSIFNPTTKYIQIEYQNIFRILYFFKEIGIHDLHKIDLENYPPSCINYLANYDIVSPDLRFKIITIIVKQKIKLGYDEKINIFFLEGEFESKKFSKENETIKGKYIVSDEDVLKAFSYYHTNQHLQKRTLYDKFRQGGFYFTGFNKHFDKLIIDCGCSKSARVPTNTGDVNSKLIKLLQNDNNSTCSNEEDSIDNKSNNNNNGMGDNKTLDAIHDLKSFVSNTLSNVQKEVVELKSTLNKLNEQVIDLTEEIESVKKVPTTKITSLTSSITSVPSSPKTTTTTTTSTSLTIPKNYKPSSEDNDDGYMSYGNDDYDDDNSGIGLNNSDDDLIKGLPTSNGDSINDTIEKEKEKEKSKNISSNQQPTIASIKGKGEGNMDKRKKEKEKEKRERRRRGNNRKSKEKKSSSSPTSSSTSTSTSKKNDGSENKRVSKNKKSPKTIEELRNDSELMKIDVYKRIVTEGTQPRFVSFVNSTPKIKPNGMADSNKKLYDVIIKDVNGKKLCRGWIPSHVFSVITTYATPIAKLNTLLKDANSGYKPPEWDEQDKRQNPQEYSRGEENDKDSGESEDN